MAQTIEPVWIETELALAIHDRQLAEHGGPIGVRDPSALAAAYAYGVARNDPFTDGNKRTA